MMDARHISQDDLALLALQSLSHDEAEGVRAHLAECVECRTELARLEGDLAMVALSVDQEPLPVGARARFAAKIAGDLPIAERARPVQIDSQPRLRSRGWIGWAAAAVLLIVAGNLWLQVKVLKIRLGESVDHIASLEADRSRAEQVAEVLTAPRAQKVLLTAPKAPPAPSGRVVYLASKGELILQASNLAPTPAGKTYELWIIPADGTAPIPAGLFGPDQAGNGAVVLPSIPVSVAAKAFGVTLENAGGSKTPTAPIMLAGAVTASGE